MVIPGKPMVRSIGFPWNSMAILWKPIELTMDIPWVFHGIPMSFLWLYSKTLEEISCTDHGKWIFHSRYNKTMAIFHTHPWKIHGIDHEKFTVLTMKNSWYIHGYSHGFSMVLAMDLPWTSIWYWTMGLLSWVNEQWKVNNNCRMSRYWSRNFGVSLSPPRSLMHIAKLLQILLIETKDNIYGGNDLPWPRRSMPPECFG